MQVISTHFEKSEAKIKILLLYTDKYKIIDVVIKISSFKEFVVEIFQISKKRLEIQIEKVWVNNKSFGNKFYFFVKKLNKARNNFDNTLMKIELNEEEENDSPSILWTSDALKTNNIRSFIGSNFLGVVNDDEGIIYIFDLIEEKYSGFIDLNAVLSKSNNKNVATQLGNVSDMCFCRDHAKGSLIVYYKDSVNLFSQMNTEHLDSYQDEAWTLIHTFDNVLNLNNIKSVKMLESYYGKLLFIINNKYFLSRSRFLADVKDKIYELGRNDDSDSQKNVSFEGLFTIFQESKPIYHPQLLKQFFMKGHINLVLKVLIKMNSLLQFETRSYKIPSLCELSVENIISELQLEKVEVKKEQPKKQADTAASLFSAFSWDNDITESKPLFGSKKDEEDKESSAKPKEKNTLQEEFEEIKDSLIDSLQGENQNRINLSGKSKTELVRFVRVFQKLYSKDFYSDILSNALLRKFNFDKEYNVMVLTESKEVATAEDIFGFTKTAADKILESIKSEDSNENLEPWNTMQVAFAYHSKDQDVIFNQVKTDVIDWELFKKLSIPIWLKDTEKIKILLEGVAKTVYRKAGEKVGVNSRAAFTALWYILINRKSTL